MQQQYTDPNTGMVYTTPVPQQQYAQQPVYVAQPQAQAYYVPQQQTTTTVVTENVPQAQPGTQVVVVQAAPAPMSNETMTSWILFAIGFFTLGCFLWLPGAVIGLRSKEPTARVPGILNAVFASIGCVAVIIIIIAYAVAASQL